MATRRNLTRRAVLTAGMTAAGTAALAGCALANATPSPPAPVTTPAAMKFPLYDTVDVLVVGGGPAGIGAALAAARTGARMLLVENHSFFGGVAAWALGMPMNQVRPAGKPRSAIHELLIQKITAFGDQAVRFGTHEMWCNVEYLKVAILDALDEVKARYLVHVRAVDTLVENNRVTGVLIGTKRGLMRIMARAVVDCTGDGDVALYAGAETMVDPTTLMPMTLSLALTNVDSTKVKPSDIATAIRAGRQKLPLIPSGFLEVAPIAHGRSLYINHSGTADLGRVDATDLEGRTKAECLSRRQVLQMVQGLRQDANPALQQIELVGTGPQVGVRETRRIKGSYIVTEEDAKAGRSFEDAIAWRSGYIDPGGLKGTGLTQMKIHDVPYRAIVPEKLDGLLMAGRCISATHDGATAGKSMGNCLATGHAAGLAAALAAQKGLMPRDVNVPQLRAALRADGVSFDLGSRDQTTLR